MLRVEGLAETLLECLESYGLKWSNEALAMSVKLNGVQECVSTHSAAHSLNAAISKACLIAPPEVAWKLLSIDF
jgi:hypothetical protein